jgi:hypothetical protein
LVEVPHHFQPEEVMKIHALAFALLLAAITASAQTPTAGITGRVTDANGAVNLTDLANLLARFGNVCHP